MRSFRFAINRGGKDKTWDFNALTTQFEDAEGTLQDVIGHVQSGHALCAGLLGGQRRSKSNIIGSQWLLLDIDSGLTIDKAIAHPFIQEYAALIYTSASHKPAAHKFRIVFLLPDFVEGSETIEILVQNLMGRFPHDPACKDASRVFYGNTRAEFPLVNFDACLPDDWVEQAIAQARIEREFKAIEQAERQNRRLSFEASVQNSGATLDDLVRSALSFIPPRTPGTNTYDESLKVLMSLHSHYGDAAEAIAESWSPSGKGWNIGAKLRTFRQSGVTIASLFEIAKRYGFRFPERVKQAVEVDRKAHNIEQAKAVLACTLKPEVRLNQRYIDSTALPKLSPGDILAISSAVGTGKTEVLKTVVAAHRAEFPDCWILFVGYRNSLLHQTGQRLRLPHIQQLERDYPGNLGFALKQEKAALLCLDSLTKVPWDSLPANSLLIFDEAEATANHGLSGGTLGDRQNNILQLWQAIATRTLATGGNVLLLEDSLTDIGLSFYRGLTGDRYPIRLVQNDWKPERKATLSTSGSSGFVAKILVDLESGKKLVVPTDSQVFCEKLARLAEIDSHKVLRLDSKTVELPEVKAFQSNPNAYIEQHKPDLIILSPSVESGVSIDALGFHVRANLTSADTRRQFQLLSRVRNPESIEILTKSRGILSDDNWQTNPDALVKQWAIAAKHTAILSGIEAELSDQSWSSEAQAALAQLQATLTGKDSQGLFWARHAANFKARENLLRGAMAENLEGYLKDRGFEVELVAYPFNKIASKLFNQAGKEIELETAQKLHALPGGQSEATARSILSSGSATYPQRLNAQKSLLQARLPGANLTEDFLLEAYVQDRGKGLKSAVLLWNSRHPDIAKKLDRASFRGQLSKGFVLGWRLSHHAQKADLFQQSGLEAVIALSGAGAELSEADPIVQKVKTWALNNAAAIWRNFRLNVKPEQSAIAIVSKLLRRFGYELSAARRVGARGEQSRLWVVIPTLNTEHQAEIFEALNRKWEADLRQADKPVATIFNSTKPYIKIVATEPDPPPKAPLYKAGDTVLFALDGSTCQVEQVKGTLIRLRRLDGLAGTLKFDALPSELRAIA